MFVFVIVWISFCSNAAPEISEVNKVVVQFRAKVRRSRNWVLFKKKGRKEEGDGMAEGWGAFRACKTAPSLLTSCQWELWTIHFCLCTSVFVCVCVYMCIDLLKMPGVYRITSLSSCQWSITPPHPLLQATTCKWFMHIIKHMAPKQREELNSPKDASQDVAYSLRHKHTHTQRACLMVSTSYRHYTLFSS